jgi:hypothetical protein
MTRLNKLLSFLVTAIILVSVTGCNYQASSTKNIGSVIESSLDTIVSEKSVAMSSSPGDYIAANEEAYKVIVNLGQPSLKYLTDKFEQGSENGLRQWIMAKACSDILGKKDPVKNWSSGKDWYQKYRDLK